MEQREGVTLAVVAGGRGERLGGVVKGLLVVEGRTVVERLVELGAVLGVEEVLLVANEAKPYEGYGLRVVGDAVKGRGAPGGVHAALAGARTEWVVAVACDMPFVRTEAVRRLLEERGAQVDAVCFEVAGRVEPLLGLYRASLAGAWGEALESGNPSLRRLLEQSRARLLPEEELRKVDAEARSVESLNTPEDLRRHGVKSPLPLGEG